MTSQEKMFTSDKQVNSNNEVKPFKPRNLNPVDVPTNVAHLSEILEAQKTKKTNI